MSFESVVVAAEDQVFCDLHGEAVILNLRDGRYYGLNSVGARIWELVQKPRTVLHVCEALAEEYAEVPRDRISADVLELFEELAAAELIEVTADTSGSSARVAGGESAR